MIAIAALAVAFVLMTMLLPAGLFNSADLHLARAMRDAWNESLHPVFQLIAELGGIEVTTILMAGLFFYLWRNGYGTDSLVVVAFVGALVLEVLYKLLLYHPGPPHSLAHADGPSVSELLLGSTAGNSFPSGHVVRAVVAYGLVAFVIRRLSASRLVRATAVAVPIVVVLVLTFDRLYLDVHWLSDVIGGLLLGAIALLAGTIWLDRPRKADN